MSSDKDDVPPSLSLTTLEIEKSEKKNAVSSLKRTEYNLIKIFLHELRNDELLKYEFAK